MQVPDNHSEDPTKEPSQEEVNPPKCIQNDALPGCTVPQKPKEEKERRQEEAKKEGKKYFVQISRLYIFHRLKPRQNRQQ